MHGYTYWDFESFLHDQDLVVQESRRDLTALTWLRTGGTSNQRRALDDIGAVAAKKRSEPVAAGHEPAGQP